MPRKLKVKPHKDRSGEMKWQKETYHRFYYNCRPKELGDKMAEILKSKGSNFGEWIKPIVAEYVERNEDK